MLNQFDSYHVVLGLQLEPKHRYLTEFFSFTFCYERGFYQSASQVATGCKFIGARNPYEKHRRLCWRDQTRRVRDTPAEARHHSLAANKCSSPPASPTSYGFVGPQAFARK